jgi:hypothetical protein
VPDASWEIRLRHQNVCSPQVRFDHAADEQLEHMWASFYPAATAHGPAFRAALRAALAGRDVTAGT